MPIYEYHCEGCGVQYEKIVLSPSTAPPPQCPKCGSREVSKLISVPGACGAPAAGYPYGNPCGRGQCDGGGFGCCPH